MKPNPPAKKKFEEPSVQQTISWFPGHMYRAQKLLLEEVKKSDLVLEMRDARLPLSSSNPFLMDLVPPSKKILLLNKAELADKTGNQTWSTYFRNKGVDVRLTDIHEEFNPNILFADIRRKTAHIADKFLKRGIRPPPVRVMVVGMPNVGKSTLINRMLHKQRMPTAPTPGFTKNLTWVHLKNNIMLLDSPGVMLPRIDGQTQAMKLTWIGCIRDSILGVEPVAAGMIEYFKQLNNQNLISHYGIEGIEGDSVELILREIGNRRGILSKGGSIDAAQTCQRILLDYRKGYFGRNTLEDIGCEVR